MATKGSPINFGRTELTKYETRHFEFLRVCKAGGLRVKITGIRCGVGSMDDALVDRAEKHIRHLLPVAAALEGDHHELGFAVLHEGVHTTWLLMHWWAHGEICCQELAAAVGDGAFETIAVPFHACVWENVVLNHEHQAWVSTMLNGAPDPEKYLNDVMVEGEY